jgi:hypothetical protein
MPRRQSFDDARGQPSNRILSTAAGKVNSSYVSASSVFRPPVSTVKYPKATKSRSSPSESAPLHPELAAPPCLRPLASAATSVSTQLFCHTSTSVSQPEPVPTTTFPPSDYRAEALLQRPGKGGRQSHGLYLGGIRASSSRGHRVPE